MISFIHSSLVIGKLASYNHDPPVSRAAMIEHNAIGETPFLRQRQNLMKVIGIQFHHWFADRSPRDEIIRILQRRKAVTRKIR